MNKCSFCTAWCSIAWSTAIVQEDLVLAHTDCKKMDLHPIRAFFEEKPSVLNKPAPKLKSPYLPTKSGLFSVCMHYSREIAPIGHPIVTMLYVSC